ncbi:MAG: hypothetical protein COA85_10390 [Robiginitomaculum sp.]|nr:MAG: hypothetical protein COA85_10390 [Robiginitomaculum sp.]
MDLDITPWLNMAIRWLHVIAGIAWIGSSFYFIWLDNSLRPEKDEKDKGVFGALWAVHGGGFYHKKKYLVAPDHMPDDLHWFKWEAYTTWLSGFALLALMYYWSADLYLIDRSKLDMTNLQATGLGLLVLAAGWLIYDGLCKSPLRKNNALLGAVWFFVLMGFAYGLNLVFSGRGAVMHMGAIVGTAMAANVFFIIIPNQRKVVASMLAGKAPDPKLGQAAKQRSLHNNYMTLPVVLIMFSNHYPLLFGNPYNWALLAGFAICGMLIRHFFNRRHKDDVQYGYLVAGAAVFIATMVFAAASQNGFSKKQDTGTVTFTQVKVLMDTHCTICHAQNPAYDGFDAAPAGLILTDKVTITAAASRIYDQVVVAKIMPLGNETGMTEDERTMIGTWAQSVK